MRVKYLFQPPVVTAVLFLIINTVLLVDTARYAASVRLFPLLLGVPVAVGFLVVLLAELVPGLREWVPGLERRDFLGTQRFRRPPLSPLRPPAGTNRGPTSESRRVRAIQLFDCRVLHPYYSRRLYDCHSGLSPFLLSVRGQNVVGKLIEFHCRNLLVCLHPFHSGSARASLRCSHAMSPGYVFGLSCGRRCNAGVPRGRFFGLVNRGSDTTTIIFSKS